MTLTPNPPYPTLLHPSPANPAAGLYYLAELIEEYTVATSRIIKYMIWVSGSFSRSRPGLARPASAAESGDCLVWNDCGTENPNSEGVLLTFLSPARYRLSLHYGGPDHAWPSILMWHVSQPYCHSLRYSGAIAMTGIRVFACTGLSPSALSVSSPAFPAPVQA